MEWPNRNQGFGMAESRVLTMISRSRTYSSKSSTWVTEGSASPGARQDRPWPRWS